MIDDLLKYLAWSQDWAFARQPYGMALDIFAYCLWRILRLT